MIMSLALIGHCSGPPERDQDGTPIEALRKAIKWDRAAVSRKRRRVREGAPPDYRAL